MSNPKIEDKDFYNKINDKYRRYKIAKKKKSIKEICFPKKFQLQIPQLFLAEYIGPDSPYKGLMIFHKIGSGKTCTAIRIGEEWKSIRKICVVVPASLIGNFRNELRSKCADNSYLTNKEREQLKNLHPLDDEFKEIIARSNERIDQYYKIFSYNKFIEDAKDKNISLRNAILIIDEVQNMVSEEGVYYNILYETIYESPRDLRVILLSATPMFDKPVEIALTLNLLRIPYELPTGKEFYNMFVTARVTKSSINFEAKNLDIFKERIKGYISYFRGAPAHVFPEMVIRYVRSDMSDFQLSSYSTVLKSEEKKFRKMFRKKLNKFKKGHIVDLPNNFYIGTRIISNIAFPNRKIGEQGYESLRGKNLLLENVQNYSIKFYKIIKKIKSSSGPVFVYSNFKEYGGIKSFVRILEAQGYKSYIDHGEGRKRFAIWSGDEKQEIREEIKNVFNRPENFNGSQIKVLIGSPSSREGISVKNVRQVHVMEPYWNWSRIMQIIGRAVRYCSHKDLPEEQRNVRVYIYIATHPTIKETIDQYVMKLALKKHRLIEQFEQALKETAIDCELFKNANVDENEDIKCET